MLSSPVRHHVISEASPVSPVSPVSPAKPASQPPPPTTTQDAGLQNKKVSLSGRSFALKGVLGKGSFGTVYCGTEERPAGEEAREVAVKEIRCKCPKECKQAEYEASLLQKLSTETSRPSGGARRLACPEWFASQKVTTGPSQWTVLIAMEKVCGTPLDEFAQGKGNRRPYREAVRLSYQLLEQLCPTLHKVASMCVHRDINAHNILITPAEPAAAEAGDEGAAPSSGDTFTLIDFGLATESTSWRAGDWKVKDIGGDCRYWPVSSWKLFLFGYKYLAGNQQWTNEYTSNLDVHTMALTCIQLLAEVSEGPWPQNADAVREAWSQYWSDAVRFWKQLYSCFKSRGDWNALKAAFLQQQVAETTKRNLDRLRASLASCAGGSEEQSAFFATLGRMLAGTPVEWSELQQKLAQVTPQEGAPARPSATGFQHRRCRTIGSTAAMTKDVPDMGAARFRDTSPQDAPGVAEASESPKEAEAKSPGRHPPKRADSLPIPAASPENEDSIPRISSRDSISRLGKITEEFDDRGLLGR